MTIFIDDETMDRIRDRSNIVDVISTYVDLKKTGANYMGLCPFHNEKTPSFSVSDSKQFFHCFGCGEGGDVVSFIMKKENLSFPEAAKFLAEKLGIEVKESQDQNSKISEEKKIAYDINRDAAKFFFENLQNNKDYLNYLHKRRISMKTIRAFGLGLALDKWESLYDHLESKGYDPKLVEKLGLIGERNLKDGYYDKFRGRIIFPIIDTKGRVIGFGGRVIDKSMPKYLNSMESFIFSKGSNLYGLNYIHKHSDRKRIIIVEGYMDVIALFGKGIDYSVASLGTAFTSNQAKLLKRYGQNIYTCFDSDQAGINATMKAISLLQAEGVDPKIIMLDSYKDPDDFLRDKSLEDFESKINLALSPMDFKLHVYKGMYDLDNLDQKIDFTKKIASIIRDLESPVEREVYIDKISKETKISKEAIEKEVYGDLLKKENQKIFKRKRIQPINADLLPAATVAEIDLIKIMLYENNYFKYIKSRFSEGDFDSPILGSFIELIENEYLEKENIDEKEFFTSLEENSFFKRDFLDKIQKREFTLVNETANKMINDLLNTMILHKLKKERHFIKKEIEKLEKVTDKTVEEEKEFIWLCMELIKLNKELSSWDMREGGN